MFTLLERKFKLNFRLQALGSHSGSCSPRCHHMIRSAPKKLLLGWMHTFSLARAKRPKQTVYYSGINSWKVRQRKKMICSENTNKPLICNLLRKSYFFSRVHLSSLKVKYCERFRSDESKSYSPQLITNPVDFFFCFTQVFIS